MYSRKDTTEFIFVRKKEKSYQQYGICCHGAENLGIQPIYEANSGKESTMDQLIDICKRVCETTTCDIQRVCVTIKKYSVEKPP